MTTTPQSNGHDKAAQLHQLNREYQPLLAALNRNEASATHANKLAQMEYHRKRQAILNGHDQDRQEELRT
jgi:hypothetical protein